MGSHGAQVECQAAFSRIAKWKANEEELDFHHRLLLHQRQRRQAAQEVLGTRTTADRTTTKRDQMDTDTSPMD
jgi:hypothetical protein